jgi:hypothetical protein
MKLKIFFIILFSYNYAFAIEAPQFDRSQGLSDDLNVIGVECNKKANALEIGYFFSNNLPPQPMDLWDTFHLKKNKKDGDYVESVQEIVRTCSIGNDQYIVKIRAVPGNWNLNGECGARTYGGAKILKNGVLIFDANFEECRSKEIISKVRITTDQNAPVVTTMTYKDYYGFE